MNVPLGIGLVAVGAVVGSLTSLVLWRRFRAVVTVPLLAAVGLTVGAGALLVQDHVPTADWAVALAGIGLLVPLHVRVVFGPPGRSGDPGVVADGPRAA